MRIYTVIIESWTVPGAHVQSFIQREAAEGWLRDQFAEYLLSDIQEEMDDEDSDIHEVEDWLLDALSRVQSGIGTVSDYSAVIDAFNDLKEWAASLEIIENELDDPARDALLYALRPFAGAAAVLPEHLADKTLLFSHFRSLWALPTELRVGDFRTANAAIRLAEAEGV